MKPDNVVLIGMPGSGKSTIGVLMAKRLGLGFIDTDLLIQQDEGRTLQTIVDTDGYRALRHIEERVLMQIDAQGHVISTGGSAVYSESAMQHLKRNSVVVFLDIPFREVRRRIGDFSLRGISRHPEQALDDLFEERYSLYKRYADLTIESEGKNPEQVCDELELLLRNYSAGAPEQPDV